MACQDTLYESCAGEFVSNRGEQAGLYGSQAATPQFVGHEDEGMH